MSKQHPLTHFCGYKPSLWLLTTIFCISIIAKNLLFHQFCFYESLFSAAIWNSPIVTGAVLLPKISVGLLLAGIVLLTPRKYWTIVFSFIFDIWCIANLAYYRSTASMIDIATLSMVDNMKGFWDSVWFLLSWKDLTFPCITLLYTLLLCLFNTRKINWKNSILMLLLAYGITLLGLFCMTKRWDRNFDMCYEPLSKHMRRTLSGVDYTLNVRETSLIHSWGFMLLDMIESEQSKHDLTPQDHQDIAALIGEDTPTTFDEKLVIILVESLEDWAINPTSMPNLYHFLKTHPTLWVHKISKQTENGASSDGQLIINTGLLPISRGATCYLFPANKYPSIASRTTSQAATIIPHEITVWNQHHLSKAWGYDTTIVRTPNDSLLATQTIHLLHHGYQMVQLITLSSHIPFTYGASRSSLQLPESMPRFMADYMKSLHYADAGLSVLLNAIDSDSILQHTTFVITGDHTIFYPDQRTEYKSYCTNAGMNYDITEAYCPLIIYSPKHITQHLEITDVNYQMDIYPTIMSLMGCESYFWQGVGVNLLDQEARHNRRFNEREAYRLSDIIIRSNYFEQ